MCDGFKSVQPVTTAGRERYEDDVCGRGLMGTPKDIT